MCVKYYCNYRFNFWDNLDILWFSKLICQSIIKVWSTFSKVVGVGKAHKYFEGAGGVEPGIGCGLEHGTLHAVQPVEQLIRAHLDGQLAAVKNMILAHIEDAVLHKAHQAREVHLTVLALQELLQVVVAQGAVFDVDLADYAHLDLGHPGHRDGRKILCNEREGVLHFPGSKALAGQQNAAQTLDPQIDHPVSGSLFVLVRGHLIAQGTMHKM